MGFSLEMRSAALVGLLLLPRAILAQALCYGMNGVEMDEYTHPCFPDAEYSPCCVLTKPQGSNTDICLSSGLCYAQDSGYQGLIFMNGCTDESFRNGACPDVCSSWIEGQNLMDDEDWDGKVAVQQCGRGNVVCCRRTDDDRSCCDDEEAVLTYDVGTLLLNSVTQTRTQTVTQGASDATGAPDTTTTTVTETVSATGECGLQDLSQGNGNGTLEECPADNTAVVAGSVGGVLGAALLASIGIIVFLWRRQRGQSTVVQHPGHPQAYAPAGQYPINTDKYAGSMRPTELQSNPSHYHEMQS